MNVQGTKPLRVAIDAQISAKASGGTETALLSLLSGLGAQGGRDRFLLLTLKGYDHEIVPFKGSNMDAFVWPGTYRWYDPRKDHASSEMKPRWHRLQRALGPFGRLVPKLHRYYAHDTPLTPKALKIARSVGPLKRLVGPAYRLYRGIRDEKTRPMVSARADSLLRSRGVQLVHFPYPLHFETSLPFVYEPWGLPHRHQPDCFAPGEVEWMDRLFSKGCRNAAMVVTATRWVKQDIVEKYGISPEKIAVIPRMPRFDRDAHTMDTEEALAGLPESFALFPSATWVTKNHVRLIRAIAKLRDTHAVRLNLVCTGRNSTPEFARIKTEIEKLGLSDQVRFLGVVSIERLNALFKHAKFLVHPSIFEGLGLPLLEAFHYGLPVVASTASCIPEVVGSAALPFDPFDEDDIARALFAVCNTPELLDDLRAKGKQRIEQELPNVDQVAKMFQTVYRHVASAPLSAEQRVLLNEMLA